MKRSTLVTLTWSLTGVLLPASLRLTGLLPVKPGWVRPLFILDVVTTLLWGIIITYLIWTRKK